MKSYTNTTLRLVEKLRAYLSKDTSKVNNVVLGDSILYNATVNIVTDDYLVLVTQPIRESKTSIVVSLTRVGSYWCVDSIYNREEIENRNLYFTLKDIDCIRDMLAFLTSQNLSLELNTL